MSERNGFGQPLYGCLDDLGSCATICCVPFGCCFIQSLAVNDSNSNGMCIPFVLLLFLGPLGGAINRKTIRNVYKISGNICWDLFLHCCCMMCAISQEFREVHARSIVE